MAVSGPLSKRALFAFLLAGVCSINPGAFAKTLVLANAQIYTVNRDRPWADAMAIDDNGIIISLGSESEVFAKTGEDVDVVDLEGHMVMPGFQDVHLHAVEAGINEIMCAFEPFDTLEGYRLTVQGCAENGDTGKWILGSGVNMANLLELHNNPVEVLDAVSPERPVLVLDDLGHGAWINSVAMRAAGYDKIQGDPGGGIILRNAKTGKPNGVVLENAQQKLRTLAFPPTKENVDFAYESLLQALETLTENGVTSVSDAGGYWLQGHHKTWLRAEKEGTLTVRASNALYVYPDLPFDRQIADLKKHYSNDPDAFVRFNQAKIYVDGILSQATGAVLEPYEPGLGLEAGEEHGFLYFGIDPLNKYARVLSEAGFQLHFHVTGDRGARLALDAIEQADPQPGPHRLTHLYLVDEQDFDRFRELGAVADLQLAPSSLDPEYAAFVSEFIGERSERTMPAGSLLARGALVTLSSDWDADDLSPLLKIETAVSRRSEGAPDLATAIEMVTINPARLLRHDDKTGSIETGKFADLIVLDKNILELPTNQISETRIRATLLQGEPVYDPSGLFKE